MDSKTVVLPRPEASQASATVQVNRCEKGILVSWLIVGSPVDLEMAGKPKELLPDQIRTCAGEIELA
jgi:hypothetical protein